MKVRKLLLAALVTALAFEGVAGVFGGVAIPSAEASMAAARTPVKNCYDIPAKVYAPSIFGISFGEVSIPGQRGCLTTRPNGVRRMRTTVPFSNKPSCRVYPGATVIFSTADVSMTTTRTSKTSTITTVWCDLRIQILGVPTFVTFSWKMTREIFTWGTSGKVTELTQATTCKLDHLGCNAPTVLSFTSH